MRVTQTLYAVAVTVNTNNIISADGSSSSVLILLVNTGYRLCGYQYWQDRAHSALPLYTYQAECMVTHCHLAAGR